MMARVIILRQASHSRSTLLNVASAPLSDLANTNALGGGAQRRPPQYESYLEGRDEGINLVEERSSVTRIIT